MLFSKQTPNVFFTYNTLILKKNSCKKYSRISNNFDDVSCLVFSTYFFYYQILKTNRIYFNFLYFLFKSN